MNKLLKLITSIAIVSVLLFVASCSFSQQDEVGSLVLPSARAMGGEDAKIRYTLERNESSVKMNGKDAITADYSKSVRIDNLNPGSGYKLLVSYGYEEGKNFKVTHLKTSNSFSIMAGTTTEVSLKLDKAPEYTFLTKNGAQSSAVYIKGIRCVLDGTELIYGSSTEDLASANGLSGVSVTSLSRGLAFEGEGENQTVVEELWLNTNKGIYRRIGTNSYEKNMPTLLSPIIQLSRAVEMKDDKPDAKSSIVAVYSAGKQDIGFIFATEQKDFTLPTTDEDGNPWGLLAEEATSDNGGDILDTITGDIILDFAANENKEAPTNNIYYLVSPLGTIIGSSDLEDDDGSDFVDRLLKPENSLKIGDGSQSIRYVSTAGSRIYAAPDKGVYVSSISKEKGSRGKTTTGFSLISGTANRKVVQLNSIQDGTTIYTAAVTEKNAVLVIKDGAIHREIPATAGMPNKSKPYFYRDGSNLKLILSGTNGSVVYTVPK